MTDSITKEERLAGARKALLNYQQADQDGFMVITSRQAIHEVDDAITAFYDAMRWRPIEEAPKDGTSTIAICADAYSPTPAITWWQDAWMLMMRPDKFVVSHEPIRWQPTHFIPLSSIPLPEKEE